MRKPNVEIKKVNLAKAQIQLLAYEQQLDAIRAKSTEVFNKYEAKLAQVETLKAELAKAESTTDTVTVVE